MEKVPSNVLLQAGLEAMRLTGMPLVRAPSKGRSMIYRAEDGDSVRVRTTNDPLLIIVAQGSTPESKLNIEGTDYILLVATREPREPGPIRLFYVPVAAAAAAARTAYRSWLDGNPATKGDNRTRTLWLSGDPEDPSRGFAAKWAEYEIRTDVSTEAFLSSQGVTEPSVSRRETKRVADDAQRESLSRSPTAERLGNVIKRCRSEIAEAAGIEVESVKISLDMT